MSDDASTTNTPTPPWGSDEDFNPEKAWKLIQNLRASEASLKSQNADLSAKVAEREDADKTETQKLADRAARAEKLAADTRRELLIERIGRKHSLPEDAVEFLTGDTEEEIEARATKLAKLHGTTNDSTTDGNGEKPPADDPALPQRPQSQLRPGHGGESTTAFDPAALADMARTRRR